MMRYNSVESRLTLMFRYPNYGLRNADAFVLVYDVSAPDSFNFITFIR